MNSDFDVTKRGSEVKLIEIVLTVYSMRNLHAETNVYPFQTFLHPFLPSLPPLKIYSHFERIIDHVAVSSRVDLSIIIYRNSKVSLLHVDHTQRHAERYRIIIE